MKRWISIFLVVVLCFGMTGVVGHAAAQKRIERYVEGVYKNLEAVTVYVNNRQVAVEAFSMDYRTYVPLRAICEALNCEVAWDAATLTATISNPLTVVKIMRGNPHLTLRDRRKPETNGLEPMQVSLDAAPVYARALTETSDTLMVPVRAISEALGAHVRWDEENYVVTITSDYTQVLPFVNDYARVCNTKNEWGYIDKNGKLVVKMNYTVANDPDENGFAIVSKNNKWGFVRMDGKASGVLSYAAVKPYAEGFAAVCDYNSNKWGYINEQGVTVIKPIYEDAGAFAENMAAVKKDGKYGYINKAGTQVISRKYSAAECFSNGYAAVCLNGKWGYINPRGVEVTGFVFDYAGPFSIWGTAAVMQNGESFYINTLGQRLYL